tara:strand:+ start:30706 stop:33111 length:2406 start_codon:yes stop_codon:yes gene_type:complete
MRSFPVRDDSTPIAARMPARSPAKLCFALLGFAVFAAGASEIFAQESSISTAETDLIRRGKAVYRESCADCHGEAGQGAPGTYESPLVGDETIGQLTARITETMPEGDPEACVGEDAAAVANFIHHAFYSAAARLRNRPPRIELARLTGQQLRQSLADLYEHFYDDAWIDDRRGLDAHYFNDGRWNPKKQVIQRIDPSVHFDFGNEGPGHGVEPEEYYVLWNGSLKVNRTGRYEIILRSTCSCMMYFGNQERELINNHVQSEGREEFRRTLRLVAGRVYPMKIEFTQRKRKTKQPPAKISLRWKTPGGVEQVIPTRHLIPAAYPATFALQTSLPPDDRSYGYERGTDINRQWDESTTNAALEFAQAAADELWPRYRHQHRKEKHNGRELLEQFLAELVQTALRGPVNQEQRVKYINRSLQLHLDDAEAIKRCMLVTLKSPTFLYPSLDTQQTESRRVANRLTLALYDSLPAEEWLLKRAEKNQLQSEKQIRETAERMIRDYRAAGKVAALMRQWLDIPDDATITKDQQQHPGFDRALVEDLKSSLDHFVDDIVWSESSDFRELLTADWTYTTDQLADFYGPSWRPVEDQGPTLRRSVGDAKHRHGILTHPLLMSHFAYHQTSSPIHRGVFLVRHVLGRTLRPPDAAFSPLNPDLHPNLTTRQRVAMQTNEVNCQVCHAKINSLGFAMEHFDATGCYREQERGQPIDASGSYIDLTGQLISFNGTAELAEYLVDSRDCHRAFVEAAFEHMIKQPIAAFGFDLADRLTDQFAANHFNIRRLFVEIAVVAAMAAKDHENTADSA